MSLKIITNSHNFVKVLTPIALSGLLCACALMQSEKVNNTEKLLAAAGFKMILANTPEKMDHLKTLSQYKLVPQQKDGVTHYIYADAANCRCFYWGQEDTYQAFLLLQKKSNITDDDKMTAQMNENEYLDWGTMGYGMGGYGEGFY
jgi:hypothetical protein